MSVRFQEDEILGKTYDASLIRRLLRYVRPYRGATGLAIALLLLASATDLVGPSLYRIAIDRYILPGSVNAGPAAADLRGVARIAALYLLILGIGFGARWLQSYLMQFVGQRAMTDLRMHIFGHVQALPVAFFARWPVGRLLTRVTHDVDALNELITSGVVAIFGDIATLVGITAVMLWMDWRLALVVFSVLPLVYLITERFRVRARDAYRAVRTRLARINAYLNEQIMGMTVVQLFTRERQSLRAFEARNDDYLQASLAAQRNFSRFYPEIQVVGTIAIALLLWYGGGQVVRQAVTLGILVAALQYADRFFEPIRDISDKFNLFQAAMASSERIFRLVDEPITLRDPPDPVPLPRVQGRIEFRDVWFAYEEDEGWVLRGLSFAIEPGQTVAVVGHTGAGKTSIINLLMRFHDPQRGEVLIDGVDVRRVRQQDLRRHVGLVLQDVFLFSGTIEDNIRLGTAAITDERIRQAARYVGADRFIDVLPDGYRTEVQERGARLSVGQKQLVALARALAFNPEILLVLDEATSSVDAETEALIQEAMGKVLRGRTSIIIAHRLSTIQHADRIIVLHKGRIAEQGTHRELLDRGGIYAKLYRLQYKDQERAG
ncbi:MAG: ABC transporter ATP-binding protein [Bacillati bacterium ANGP1]|uniref:ABC transporter ATP-binding protein n=1 Tax=Candidatus Segetimicrobium genomatis TaxID=2569760 RepID=A0A537JYL1_9BACT|nr:MAG: ABC transporter ATP-binding protein [Terrabacteria group bacterium ANGP1]